MTATAHYTGTATWTVPAGITRARAVVAGEGGKGKYADGSVAYRQGGAILSGILAVSGTLTVSPAYRAGGVAGGANAYPGGAASSCGGMVAAGAGGAGWGTVNGAPGFGGSGGNGMAPGSPGGDGGATFGLDVIVGKGGAVDGSGGAGGVAPGKNGVAGSSNASGGMGAAGVAYSSGYSGGGGAGFGGGGSGGVDYDAGANLIMGAGGGAGSSTFGGTATATSFDGLNFGPAYVDLLWAAAPYAPSQVSPVGNEVRTTAQTVTFTIVHNGASGDSLDGCSRFRVRYRLIGGSWTTLTSGENPAAFSLTTAAALPVGNYEWQAQSDSDNVVGSWSTSEYFQVLVPATTPVITTPDADSTQHNTTAALAWTSGVQAAYRARLVGDSAGVPNGADIVTDTGKVVTASVKSLAVPLIRPHAIMWLQVMVWNGADAPSVWASVKLTSDWTGPAKPTVRLIPSDGDGSLTVRIANPTAPDPTTPAAAYNDVKVSENGGPFTTRQGSTNLAPNGSWKYMIPAGDVRVIVVAVAASTGVPTESEVAW